MATADEMRALAATVDLPGSLAALTTLETRIAGAPVTEATTRAWGAFVGEVIRLALPADVAWLSYEEAAAQLASVKQLEPGYDIAAVLKVRTTYWFPLAKVEKFQRNGRSDSLAAFAGVALAMLPPTDEQSAAAAEERAQHEATIIAHGRAFAAAPTAAGIAKLVRSIYPALGPPERPESAATLREIPIRASHLVPLLGERATGRGYKRTDPGGAASEWLAALVLHGIEQRAQTFALLEGLRDKEARENAAFVRGYVDLRGGSVKEVLALVASKGPRRSKAHIAR